MSTRGHAVGSLTRNITRSAKSRSKAFSTSRRTCEEPNRRVVPDLLASIGDETSSNTSNAPKYRRFLNSRPRSASDGKDTPDNIENVQRLMNPDALTSSLRKRTTASQATQSLAENAKMATDLTKQVKRPWKTGDVYSPHDLSVYQQKKWSQRKKPDRDVFDLLSLNPLTQYKYMTPTGMIKHSKETGLRPVNQRRLARAIRRSIGEGLMPSVFRHPEILYAARAKGLVSSNQIH